MFINDLLTKYWFCDKENCSIKKEMLSNS